MLTPAGQVIVIGATNRPDAVDPALRRPGRFDREFYFPLPNLDARKRIIEINTRAWEPKLEPQVVDQLGRLTKGYGGADLRVSMLFCVVRVVVLMTLGTLYRGGAQRYSAEISPDLPVL